MKRTDLRSLRELTIGELEVKARETKEELETVFKILE